MSQNACFVTQEKAQLIMWYDGVNFPMITRAVLISHPPIGSVDGTLS